MLELAPCGLETSMGEPLGDDPFGAARETVEAVGVGLHLAPSGAGLSLWPVSRGLGEEAAQIAVAAVIGGKQGETGEGSPRRGRIGDEAEGTFQF